MRRTAPATWIPALNDSENAQASLHAPFRFFLPALILLLGGYMFFGRAFAYISIPGLPFYLGELVLAIGVMEALRLPGAIRAVLLRSRPLQIILVFMVGCAARLMMDWGTYGLDAVRDSAVWYYATFAFLVAAATISNPTFVPRVTGAYRRAVPWFLVWAPIAVVVSRMGPEGFPRIPGSDTAMNSFKIGDIAVHTAMALSFLWLDASRSFAAERRAHILFPIGVLGLLTAGTQNRGGFIVGLVILVFVLRFIPHKQQVLLSGITAVAVVLIGLVLLDPRIGSGSRQFSLDQVRTNAASVLGFGDDDPAPDPSTEVLDGTTAWRLDYWGRLVTDAFTPKYFIGGQGFGPILADEYGFQAAGQPLRSAHNSHVTILARVGVPLSVVWLVVWTLWFRSVRPAERAPSRTMTSANTSLRGWAVAAAAGMLVNAFFDPTLEGPHAGIWLWGVTGMGAALAIAQVPTFRRVP